MTVDRGDQELFKFFCGLKIRPLLRKLWAFKNGNFLTSISNRSDVEMMKISGVVSTWKPHGVHVKTTQCPHGNHMQTM